MKFSCWVCACAHAWYMYCAGLAPGSAVFVFTFTDDSAILPSRPCRLTPKPSVASSSPRSGAHAKAGLRG